MTYKFDTIQTEGASSFRDIGVSPSFKTITTTAPITQALFSPDERYLVLLLANKQIHWTDLKNQTALQQYTPNMTPGIAINALTITFSPYHSNLLVITSGNEFNFFNIEKSATTRGAAMGKINDLIFSPDKKNFTFILESSPQLPNGALQFWAIANETSVRVVEFSEVSSKITCAIFSLDGSKLICGTEDNSILIFSNIGEFILKFKIPSLGSEISPQLKACGHFLLPSSQEVIVFFLKDNTFEVFNFTQKPSTPLSLKEFNIPRQRIKEVHFPYVYLDEHHVIYTQDTVVLKMTSHDSMDEIEASLLTKNTSRNTSSFLLLFSEKESICIKKSVIKNDGKLSALGTYFLIIDSALNQLQLYNFSKKLPSSLPSTPTRSTLSYGGKTTFTIAGRGVSWCKISSDGHYWLFGYGEGIKVFFRDFENSTFSEIIIPTLPASYTSITCAAFSPDNNFLALGFEDASFISSGGETVRGHSIIILDTQQNWKQIKCLSFEYVSNFVFFISTTDMLVGFENNSAITCGFGQYNFTLPLNINPTNRKILSCYIPDKNQFMITQETSVSHIATTRGKQTIEDLYNINSDGKSILAVSTNGNVLLSYIPLRYCYEIYNITLKNIMFSKNYAGAIPAGGLSADGKYLLILLDNNVIMFELNDSGTIRLKEFPFPSLVSFCQFSPSGQEVIIGYGTGTVDIYDISSLLPKVDLISLISPQLSLDQEGFIDYESYKTHFLQGHSFNYIINGEKINLVGNKIARAFNKPNTSNEIKLINQAVRTLLNKTMRRDSTELAFLRALLISTAHDNGLGKIKIPGFSLAEVHVNFTKSAALTFYETWNVLFELRYFKTVDITPKDSATAFLYSIDTSRIPDYVSIQVEYELTETYIKLKPEPPVKLSFSGNLKAEAAAITQSIEQPLLGTIRTPSPMVTPVSSPRKATSMENPVIAKIKEVAEKIRLDE